MKKILSLLLVITSVSMFSQRRTCATMDKLHERMNADSSFAQHHKDVMDIIQNPNNTQELNRNPNAPSIVVTIPVVFHVLYKNATQNISDAQINSQLAVLNNDYRKLNADFNTVVPAAFQPLGADMEITFVKATITPTGAATTGITRKSVGSSFIFEDSYYLAAGELAWNPNQYLNIWIGRFTDNSLLGFAYLPSAAGQAFDGLCIGDQYFGTTGTASAPFNKGRTATHEIGHYFGLNHPWGNDGSSCGSGANSDGVADTPATDNPHYDCPTFPTNVNTCTTSANGAMFMNFMDYVNDNCMAFFTTGQKTIVNNAVNVIRVSLLSSPALAVNNFEPFKSISIYPNPVAKNFTIESPQVEIDEVEIFNTVGQLVKTQKLSQTNNVINIEEFESGTYYLRIYNQGQFLKSDKVIKK
jgi:hypothetical protein